MKNVFIKYRSCIKITGQRGSVLLTSFMVITALLTLGAAFLILSVNESRTAEAQRRISQALFIAEAGIQRALYDLRQDFVTDSTPDWSDGVINGWIVNTADTDADGYYPLPDTNNILNIHYAPSSLNGGTYAVRLMNVAGADDIWIRSTGTMDSISQTIQVYVKMINLSPWENAIFGGAGSAGGMVNGNVNISGSVHVLGDGLGPGDNAITLGGTAELVGNNYSSLENALKDRVPDLPTTVVNGETVSTLNAELRVKNGSVSLSGSSTVGQANQAGNGTKETVDGAYVTDGYAGNKGAANVFSDNGTSEAYDLGDAVSFPSLSDPIGAYTDYYDYFDQTAYTPSAGELAVLANLTPSVGDFQYGPTSNCTVDANCIQMSGGKLKVKGKIYVNGGTLKFSGGQMEYTGSGTILVTGVAYENGDPYSVGIQENLVTPTPATDAGGDPIPNYPVNQATSEKNIVGIMTSGNINVGTGSGASQLNIMGLFYAENTIAVAKQTDLIGTIVTNLFDLSGQVPSIFQVPETSNNLPDGMISQDPVWLMRVISWQKI